MSEAPTEAFWEIWYDDGGHGEMQTWVLRGPVERRVPRFHGGQWEQCRVIVGDDEGPYHPSEEYAWKDTTESVEVVPIYEERVIDGVCASCNHSWQHHTPTGCLWNPDGLDCDCTETPEQPKDRKNGRRGV